MKLAPSCPINLDALLRTRALIVAGSGGGKTWPCAWADQMPT